jgi:hypothetical protein
VRQLTDDAFYVQHICAYNYTESRYEALATTYRKAGFYRLRSPPALDDAEVEMVKDGRYFVNGKKQTMAEIRRELKKC